MIHNLQNSFQILKTVTSFKRKNQNLPFVAVNEGQTDLIISEFLCSEKIYNHKNECSLVSPPFLFSGTQRT